MSGPKSAKQAGLLSPVDSNICLMSAKIVFLRTLQRPVLTLDDVVIHVSFTCDPKVLVVVNKLAQLYSPVEQPNVGFSLHSSNAR